ncbi:hypothetical protein PT974_08711 [Cladobotryum mycophilum]|uniref:Uncharacterized protein n=1 Tax=Cladobotryum mycophilum TaxID=491253 RepID=A0ABR0SE41_9HYPO
MDGPQLRQRPASNTSLNSTYRAHGRPINYSNHRPTSHRRPLRSVNENVDLLRSPGPLESMLKTTTETGDIGIFSIKPRSTSTAAMYLQPSRSRSHFGDSGHLPIPRARGYEDNYFYDDHKRLRSNRDTTSEILSLYGSESQQTMLTSVSPSLDDGLRSYSLTTTSSKHIPSHKSSGTLQSQSSSGGFQRPRSPFPYPTRLKRPGVRPASPALAENGDVDYSRMVELDRFSQRTVHGSYKPTYTHGQRRPPPLSLRADANRSTTSLPSRTSPSPYYHGPPNYRVRTPNSSVSWNSRPPDRHQRSSADQSTRSASLTSIVEMYNRPITGGSNPQPLRSAGSFYYDYTEEFENQPPPDVELEIPICPIPQRAGSLRRPMVLREDSSVGLEDASNESDSLLSDHADLEQEDEPFPANGVAFDSRNRLDENDLVHAAYEDLAIAIPPPQNDMTDEEVHDQASSTPAAQKLEEERPTSPSSVSESLETTSQDMVHETAGAAQEDRSPERKTWRFSKALEAGSEDDENLQTRRASQSSLSRLRYTLDPVLSDFASILSSFDRMGKSASSERDLGVRSASEGYHGDLRYESDEDGPDFQKRLSRRSSVPIFDDTSQEGKAYRKGHRRNIAAMRISTTGVSPEESANSSHKAQECELIPSPEPLSPIRHLKMKDSVPHLMKALPPLPTETGQSSDSSTEAILQPDQGPPDKGKDHLNTKPLPSPVRKSRASLDSPPKFKIRGKTPPSPAGDGSPGILFSGNKTRVHRVWGPKASPAAKPKLKLKVSRSQLDQARTGLGIPGLPNNRLKQCNSLAELRSYPKNNGPNGNHALETLVVKQEPKSNIEDELKREEEGLNCPPPSPQPSDQFNIPYPPSPEKVEATLNHNAPMNKEVVNETPSVSSNDCPSGHRGVRCKFSMLRLRFIGTPSTGSSNKSSPCLPTVKQEVTTLAPVSDIGVHDSNEMASDSEKDQKKWRIKRWARDAKRAVRSYVKRTLDR